MELRSFVTGCVAIFLSISVASGAAPSPRFLLEGQNIGLVSPTLRTRPGALKVWGNHLSPTLSLQSLILPFSDASGLEAIGLIPLTPHAKSIPFIGVHVGVHSKPFYLLGTGFGIRCSMNDSWVMGAHLFWDQQCYEREWIPRVSTHFEWLSPRTEIRFNAYLPVGAPAIHNEIPLDARYHYDQTAHTVHAQFYPTQAVMAPAFDITVGKRLDNLNHLKLYGGVSAQLRQTPYLGWLAGMEYPFSRFAHGRMNVAYNFAEQTILVGIGLRFTVSAHVEQVGDFASRLYGPVERDTFYTMAAPPLYERQRATPCRVLVKENAYVPEAEEAFNQTFINAANPNATFYLRSHTQAGQALFYGDEAETLTLQAGQSIIGTDAVLRPLPITREYPTINNALSLMGRNTLQAVRCKGSLTIKNDNIRVNGLFLSQFTDIWVNPGEVAVSIEQGSNIYLDNLRIEAYTEGNLDSRMKLHTLHGIKIENSRECYINHLWLSVSSVKAKNQPTGGQHHGKLYGIHAVDSTLSIKNSEIQVQITDLDSQPGVFDALGETYGVTAEDGSNIKGTNVIIGSTGSTEHVAHFPTQCDPSSTLDLSQP